MNDTQEMEHDRLQQNGHSTLKSMSYDKKSLTYDKPRQVEGRFIDLQLPKEKKPMDMKDYYEGKRWSWITRDARNSWFMQDVLAKVGGIIEEKKERNNEECSQSNAGNLLEEEIKKQEKIERNKSKEVYKNLLAEYNHEQREREWFLQAGIKCGPEPHTPKVKNDKEIVGCRTVALGSEDQIYSTGDIGLLGAVLEAYNNHWNLRVSPDDFWFPVARRVASIIDKNAKSNKVRDFFVKFQGKKELEVKIDVDTIYEVPYPYLFDKFSKAIRKNIKVPDYAKILRSDFSTTTPEMQIVSDITLMSSLQEYFDYCMMLGCGIKGVELLGGLEDWMKLQTKLEQLVKILSPIEDELKLKKWLEDVKDVFAKLVSTYQGSPDTEWWSKIISCVPFGSGGQTQYEGWIINFLEGKSDIKKLSSITSGLVSVPMKIKKLNTGLEDMSALVAGMIGFTIHEGEETENGIPSVRPYQGWALLLPEDSPFRKK